jgi:hypothetical protein
MNPTTLLRYSSLTLGLLALAVPSIRAADSAPANATVTPPAGNVTTPAVPATATAAPALKDADGRTLKQATRTGHITNYYEDKIPPYTLPDPLVLANGQPVTNATVWFQQRRPEILQLYETQIYGRVPATAPKATFTLVSTDAHALNDTAIHEQIAVHFGGADGPTANVALYLPAKATGPVPLILSVSFSAAPANPSPALRLTTVDPTKAPPPAATSAMRGPGPGEPIADILARGYGYAVVRYTEIEGDRADTNLSLVRKLALAPGQSAPAPDEWGTISAWAWGLSRIVDYLETNPAVDAKRIALVGHSRLGKTVLWAGAQDDRFAVVYSSQGGEMGSSLARRDFGESVDDMAQNFPWQFAGNFQKYPGHWNDMPVDTHFLISLIAPRPLLISGGSGDQWSDPKGEFLGEVAAGPVYRLVGKKDLGTTEMPGLDTPVVSGDLAYYEHTGPHAITMADWKVFLDFADRYLHPVPVSSTAPASATPASAPINAAPAAKAAQ